MSNSDKLIVVTGATGQQGGATARHLLKQGWRVRALTRIPRARPLKRWQPLAPRSFRAIWTTGPRWIRPSRGRTASSACRTSGAGRWRGRRGAPGQHRGRCCQGSRVQHFVYTSVGGADRKTGLSHFESKWQIEEHIRR